MHKKIEYLLPELTTEVERREWDSNLEAVVRGLYSMSDFTNVSLGERQGVDLLKLNIEYEKLRIKV
jgi:hypothetical protein